MLEASWDTEQFARRIIGAAIEVHRVIGPGYVESVYERALCLELELRGIAFERQPAVRVSYKGHVVGEGRLDLVVEPDVVVELKAAPALLPVHKAQILAYLKATRRRLGLLVNFNAPVLTVKRIINGVPRP